MTSDLRSECSFEYPACAQHRQAQAHAHAHVHGQFSKNFKEVLHTTHTPLPIVYRQRAMTLLIFIRVLVAGCEPTCGATNIGGVSVSIGKA